MYARSNVNCPWAIFGGCGVQNAARMISCWLTILPVLLKYVVYSEAVAMVCIDHHRDDTT